MIVRQQIYQSTLYQLKGELHQLYTSKSVNKCFVAPELPRQSEDYKFENKSGGVELERSEPTRPL